MLAPALAGYRLFHVLVGDAEVLFFFQGNLFFFDSGNLYPLAVSQLFGEEIYVTFPALDLHFHPAVLQICNPSGQAQLTGRHLCRIAEAHALDFA